MRRRITLLVSALAIAFSLTLGRAEALQAADPSSLINNLVAEAIANIADRQAVDTERETKFRALLESGFDIPRISRFVLGRYWAGASDQERQRFAALFEEWIVRSYAARFKEYSGETIKVTGSRMESETSTVVLSQFIKANAPPAKVEWHVRKLPDGSFKIIDVAVEGISMALAQRDEIASVADRSGGTTEGLNKALEARLAGTAEASAAH